MPEENSLFTQINSLFRRKFSLFGCVGNSVEEANDYAWLERCIRTDNARNRENSLYFPWITGNEGGEWFAGDCALRQLSDCFCRENTAAQIVQTYPRLLAVVVPGIRCG